MPLKCNRGHARCNRGTRVAMGGTRVAMGGTRVATGSNPLVRYSMVCAHSRTLHSGCDCRLAAHSLRHRARLCTKLCKAHAARHRPCSAARLDAPSCACVQLRQRVPKCADLETCQGAKANRSVAERRLLRGFRLTNQTRPTLQRAISLGRIGRTRIALLCFACGMTELARAASAAAHSNH